MKKICILLLLVVSCNTAEKSPIKTEINTYLQDQGMGFITIKTISEPIQLTDSTYTATHVVFNKMIDEDVRVTNIYTIAADTIKSHHTTKTELKKDGTWRVMPL